MHQIRQKKPKPNKRNATSSSIAPTSALVDRAARSRRSRSSIALHDRTSGAIWALSSLSLSLSDLGSLFSLSLSLSLSWSYLKWKWGEKMISGSKVKILVNRKSFSGKWYFPWQPNMRKMVKMISWNHFHPKQTHPKLKMCQGMLLWGGLKFLWWGPKMLERAQNFIWVHLNCDQMEKFKPKISISNELKWVVHHKQELLYLLTSAWSAWLEFFYLFLYIS